MQLATEVMPRGRRKGKGRKAKSAEVSKQWENTEQALELFKADPQPDNGIPVVDCVPGSNIRAVRQHDVAGLMRSIKKDGWNHTSKITVLERNGQGKYKVVDGMHRITALMNLLKAKLTKRRNVRQLTLRHLTSLYCNINFVCLRLLRVCVCVCVAIDPSHRPQRRYSNQRHILHCFR